MPRRLGRTLGVLIALASSLMIAFLLAVALGPLVARLIGVNTVALSADETAVRFITLAGIGGGAGFMGGLWLMVRSRAPSKVPNPTPTPTPTPTKIDYSQA